MEEKLIAFKRLLDIMDTLRSECPWDRKQTMGSLRNLTIEECYELADAISSSDMNGIKEELGDLMLHIVFYAKIASESGEFEIKDVLNGLCDKLIKRHPHIYGNTKVKDDGEVKRNWEQIKMSEGKKSILSGVPNSLPAMIKAQVGFEWDNREQVWNKVVEEIHELELAIQSQKKIDIEGEFGDVLFSLINYARFIGIDPETALDRVNRKFKNRFEYIESKAVKPLSEMTLAEMDALWEEAKKERR